MMKKLLSDLRPALPAEAANLASNIHLVILKYRKTEMYVSCGIKRSQNKTKGQENKNMCVPIEEVDRTRFGQFRQREIDGMGWELGGDIQESTDIDDGNGRSRMWKRSSSTIIAGAGQAEDPPS
ncbi:unnamed protein product [Amoebophrya sp. A120]|nr:unnamed protein product [Amoebophrya sp. A120]|eukprot:GSA120T00023030001.1